MNQLNIGDKVLTGTDREHYLYNYLELRKKICISELTCLIYTPLINTKMKQINTEHTIFKTNYPN